MGKHVQFDDAARRALWRGVDQLASAVRVTLGPRGRSVVMDRGAGWPMITRDGLAVAQEITLLDPFENMGVQMLRDVALQTGASAGDGTSTATVLAHGLLGGGLAAIAAGHNPVAVRRGIDRATEAALRAIAEASRPIEHRRDLERIAGVAAGDHALGEMVAEALERVGRHGVVTVEESRGLDLTLDVVEGVRFAGGYTSPYFITHPESMECALDHVLLLIVDGALTRVEEIVPALEQAARAQRPLLVLCEEIEGEVLSVLVVNRLRGMAASCVVKVEGAPGPRRELFEDLAVLTGATLFAADLGRGPARFEVSDFGRARHVSVTADATTLRQGGGAVDAMRVQQEELELRLASSSKRAERDALRQRLARLGGGVAVVRVGAATDPEREQLRVRLEDALAATRSAVEEGTVTGGGVALLRAEAAVRAAAAQRRRTGGA